MRDLTNMVAYNLASRYDSVKEGIGKIMGGQVLDLPVIRILNEGRKEGLKRGREEVMCEAAKVIAQNINVSIEEAEALLRKNIASAD